MDDQPKLNKCCRTEGECDCNNYKRNLKLHRRISKRHNPYIKFTDYLSENAGCSNDGMAGIASNRLIEKSTENQVSAPFGLTPSSQHLPCLQVQNVPKFHGTYLKESMNIGILENLFENNIASSSISCLNSLSQNLLQIPENLSNEMFNENLSKSTLASFEESFHTSVCGSQDKIIGNTIIKNIGDSNQSRMYRSFECKQEMMDVLNNCETIVCQLNETTGIQNDANQDQTIQQPNNLMNATNDSFMLDIPLSKIYEKEIDGNYFDKRQSPNDFYGLPLVARSLVSQYKGIEKLYDWQNECLTLAAVEKRQNLIYALPTSGGKTLVAEILMLKEVICRKKNVLFIVPFVSIVQEKVWALSPFAVGLDFFVEEYAGGKGAFPPRKRRKKKSIYIATIEKALGLVRSLSETKRLSEIGLIVVDELHLLGEPSRGCILEMLLTNVMYSGEKIQIIGMSATIGNLEELARFLNAQVFTKDFRPVELKEYVKYGKNILNINWNALDESEKIKHSRNIDFGYSSQVEKIDPDHLGGLVMEVIPDGSCLIFCPTKKNCENVSVLLCKVIAKKLTEDRKQEKNALVEALREENNGENLLLSLVPWGVAYHHSGLAIEERRLIEDAFRSGVLNVLCCTSTLAAGVNLPAQRVILRSPMVGRCFMPLSTYKQMVGRAGRAGFSGHGDSILICSSYHMERVKTLLSSPMDDACSNLHNNNSGHMITFLLTAIATETATNRSALRKLVNQTLLSVQAERLKVNLKKEVDETIRVLFKMGAIEVNSLQQNSASLNISISINQTVKTGDTEELSDPHSIRDNKKHLTITSGMELAVSKLGKATTKGGMQLHRAQQLYADLKEAQKGLVVIGIMHLLYLVTPYDLAESIKPNLSIYYSVLTTTVPDVLQTARILGFTETTEIQMAMGKLPKNIPELILNRFYVTLMLYDLWNQKSLQTVSDKFQVNRGTVQSMMEQAATFASGVYRFCEELEEFWAFKDLLAIFSQRLTHCCILELVPLMDLPCVKKNRALQLYKAGYKTIKNIAQASPNDLVEAIEHVTLKTANQLIAAAKSCQPQFLGEHLLGIIEGSISNCSNISSVTAEVHLFVDIARQLQEITLD